LDALSDGTLVLPAKTRASIKEFLAVVGRLRDVSDHSGLFDLGASLISVVGFDTALSGDEEDETRLANLYELEKAIKDYATENNGATLADYLQTVSLVQDGDNNSAADAVIISTVHSAKGLEFDNVFIIGLEDGIFPLSRARESVAEYEEERRLLYVAITRASENLYLTHAESRFFHGTRNYNAPSDFLVDLELAKPKKRFDFDY
jgi:DNA helicase-2/ATP-dependent DNA helicase PcrA